MKLNRLLLLCLALSLLLHLGILLRKSRLLLPRPALELQPVAVSLTFGPLPSAQGKKSGPRRPAPQRLTPRKSPSKRSSRHPSPPKRKIPRRPVFREKPPPRKPSPEMSRTAQRSPGKTSREPGASSPPFRGKRPPRGVPAGFKGPRQGKQKGLQGDYLARILALIEKHRYYPRLARLRGYEGRVVLEVSIEASGNLQEVRVLETSGHRILDRAAQRMIRESSPFPPPPRVLGPFPLRLRIPIRFELRSG